METIYPPSSPSTSTAPPKIYSQSDPDHAWFFGHFLNLGRHNAYLILKQLQEKHLALQHDTAEEIIEDQLHESWILNQAWKSKRHQNTLIEDFFHFFPFLRMLYGEDFANRLASEDDPSTEKKNGRTSNWEPEQIPKLLKYWLQLLNALRNAMLHHSERRWNEETVPRAEMLQKLRDAMPEELLRRYPETFEDGHVKNLEKHYPVLSNGCLTKDGLVLFTCLWLSRRQANEYFNHIKFFKDTREARFRATRYAFALFCCRPPEPRIVSSNPALDILAELSRIPHELYTLLDEANQRKFHPEAESKAEEEGDFDLEETLSAPLMTRKRDHFARFALDYFERNKCLERLRFQVRLGRVVIDSYEKSTGVIPVRTLTREVKAWGFPSQFEEPEKLGPLHKRGWLESKRLAPWVQQYRPRYHLNDWGIGLRFQDSWPTGEDAWPDISTASQTRRAIPQEPPHAILPAQELAPMLAWELMRSEHPVWEMPPAEEILEQTYTNYRRFFEDLKEGKIQPVGSSSDLNALLESYGLSGLPLPKPLRRWLLGTLSNQERKAQDWLQSKLEENLRLLLEAKRQLRKLAEPPNRPFLRAGDLATWIARDIAYWQHPDGRQLNSEEYGELQAALAFFGREGAEQVYELFEKLELVGQPNRDHPFLFRLKNRMCPARSRKRQPKPIRGILEFYIAYLRAREKFLTRLQGRLKSGSNPTPEMEHWIPPLRSRSLPPRMNERAVVLPRGLFRRRFVELLPPPDGSPADTPLEQLTLMKLLEPYLDTPQAFYRYERRYARNEHQYTTDGCNLSELIPQIENEATQGSEEEDPDFRRKDLLCLARTINDTERRLRRYQLQDRLLWMIVRQELEREKNMNLQGWTLENVGFDQPDSPLKQEITFQLEYPLEGRNEPIRIEAKLRPRHYGKMRRTLHDRRLPGLLQWLNTESVDWERLQQELTKTITRQDEVLQLIFELEKAVHSRFEKECTAKKNRDYLKHRNYLEVLREHQILRSDEEFEHLLNLRNRFAHNEVPSPAELPLWKDERPGNGNLMEWLIEKSLQLYRDLLERVQGKGD